MVDSFFGQPMATLHEVLSKSSPAIAEDAVTQFRSGLVSIINRLHDEDDECIQHSLLDQKKRLDDEGYDSYTFLTILNQVTETTIGSLATQELLSYIQENVAEPDGLPLLLAHVHSSFPELAQAIDELETLAIEEENQLLAVAGGMSKKAEIGVISGAVGGAVIGIGIAAYKKRKSMLAERAVREQQAVRDEIHSDAAKRDVENCWKSNKDQLLQEAISKGADRETIQNIIRNPDRLVRPVKSLEYYGAREIEDHAQQLALAHFYKFETGLKSQVEVAFKGELRKFEDTLRDNSEFRKEIRSKLDQEGIDYEELSWDEIKKLPGFSAMEKDVLNANDWTNKQIANYIKESGGSIDALKNAFNELKVSYAAELTKEVRAAKKDAMSRAEKDLLSNFQLDGQFARKAELKVDSDIVSKTKGLREVVASDARVFERQVEADVQAAERRGRDIDRV